MNQSIQITNDLILRNVQNERDKERFTAFNTTFNNPFEGATCACLLNHHPTTTEQDYWMVEDISRGEIVSTTCLIPWESRFCGVKLNIAQLEMVLTHPDYRGQGLVRVQVENFLRVVKKRGFDLSLIWGIPYFYRQFGFSYAHDGNTFDSLTLDALPPGSATISPGVTTRPAALDDIPRLVSMYARLVGDLDFYLDRSEEYWGYLLQHARHPIEIVVDEASGKEFGYIFRETRQSPPPGSILKTTITESCLPDLQTAHALLQRLRSHGQPGNLTQEIRINRLPAAPLTQAARELAETAGGSRLIPGGQWLWNISDVRQFLEKLSPLFETRLRASAWKDTALHLVINLYRQAWKLSFRQGDLTRIDALGFVDSSMGADGGDLCIPPDAFVRLVSGYRSLDELSDAWPDTLVKAETRDLVETLFPRLTSHISTPYHYLGDIQ